MPLYYAYLAQLLYLPSLLCLLLSSMPTQSPAPASTYTESICLVILPGVLPSLLPTVSSAVFMCSTYIIVSYAYLVCYDYILGMPTCLLCPHACYAHPCSQHCLPSQLWSALLCLPSLPCLLYPYLLHLLCLCAFPVTYALSYKII